MGRSNPVAKIVIVGEAPGEAEARTGKPFMGRAGQELNKMLARLHMKEQVYITNICKCRPPNNRRPEPVEGEICSDLYLRKEIDLLKPKVVVALGVTAANCFFPSCQWQRGVVKYSSHFDCNVIATWHPSYVLRFASHTAREQLVAALQKAKDLVGEK